jgi:hypothetical protein
MVPRLKRFMTVEMAAKREKGKCYNCMEPFSQAHLEVFPMKDIYLLQMDDDTTLEETEEVDDPRILLHVITGLANSETMQPAVRINDDILGALVDSGSTHSFISTSVTSLLYMEPVVRPNLHVTVTNGDRVASVGVCRTVHVFIDLEEFIIDLFMILLEGYDMVLGVQWLHTLGSILWDFERARMSCWRDDHRVMW